MDVKIEESWKRELASEFDKDYFIKLMNNVRREYNTKTIFPRKDQVFNAFLQNIVSVELLSMGLEVEYLE